MKRWRMCTPPSDTMLPGHQSQEEEPALAEPPSRLADDGRERAMYGPTLSDPRRSGKTAYPRRDERRQDIRTYVTAVSLTTHRRCEHSNTRTLDRLDRPHDDRS